MSAGTDSPSLLFSEEESAEIVAASFGRCSDPRLKAVLATLVRHLHAFAKDIELTIEEWAIGIEFLTATGQKCDSTRQEFILLSDVLGLSMLVDSITHRASRPATESTVLGPFHMVDSPPRSLGDNISLTEGGEPCAVVGSVRSLDGEPIANATVDVWQADEKGFYDVQTPDTVPDRNLRGLFTCTERGEFHFRTIVPAPYPIPTDGPVGQLLQKTNRHPYRPAHIHFIVSAPGYRPTTTHMFVAGSPYLDSDAVFGVKESLINQFVVIDDEHQAQRWGVTNPFRRTDIDFVLMSA